MKRSALLTFLVSTFFANESFGQGKRLSFEEAVQSIQASIEPATAKPGESVTFKIAVKLNPNWYTYPSVQNKEFESSRTTIMLPVGGDLIFVPQIEDPGNFKIKQSDSGSYKYYPEGVTWELKAIVSPKAIAGSKKITLKKFQIIICYDVTGNCLNPKTVPIEAALTVAGEPVKVEPKYAELVEKAIGSLAVPPPTPTPTAEPSSEGPKSVAHRLSSDGDHAADLKAVLDQLPPPNAKDTGLWRFLATAAAFGFLTLFTPCVFPMVPITVSIFMKQSEKQGTSPLKHALIYAGTIVILLSIAALTLLTTFSRLAVHPVTNVLLGALFVALALSLFGMFELTLPNWLSNMTSDKASKGGYSGTIFMAVSFTIVSFTCVAPFLGGFSGMAASGEFSLPQLALGAFVFGTAFASPFFLLAMFPSLIKKLPKSGDWMNMIKVSMGFLELAAALKFFRTAELRWLTPPQYFTYDMVLAAWVGILLVLGAYLLGLFKTKHDHDEHDHVAPMRIMFALISIGLAFYLLPALFGNSKTERNRPGGIVYAWVDSFLLPEPSAAEVVGGELTWSGDLRKALDDARSRNGRVFVDFTGVTCTNCKLNEREVFTKQAVKDLFKQYTLVQMYTDTIPDVFYDSAPGLERREADAMANLEFEKKAFGEEQLPLYVILKPEPGGKTTVIGVYGEGKINNEAAFIEFLKNGLK